MPVNLFGFTIGKEDKEIEIEKSTRNESFVSPDEYDGAQTLQTGGFLGTYVDFGGGIQNENQFISTYRSLALYPEVDMAIEDIVNDSVIMGTDRKPFKLNLDNVDLSDNIKQKIHKEYNYVLSLFDISNKGYEVFRRWYIDGRLYYHLIIDIDNPRAGIKEARAIDPIKIKKVRKINKKPIIKDSIAIPMVTDIEEFFVYTDTDRNSQFSTTSAGVKITKDSIAYVHSGIVDTTTKKVVGYLQKAIRPVNMLRQIEDAVVIYRISRAPERRIFYIDVGNLPKQKAEQYVKELMNRYRNKLTYNQATGEVRDDRNHLHMLEDYWLPRREGGRGTEISTLQGGQNLGQMDDVEYLQRKLFRALSVPLSRLESVNGFNMGRSAEITRDEVKFYKFINRLREKFTQILTDTVKKQLILKGVLSENDWDYISNDIKYTFNDDSYFTELRDTEILKERMSILATVEPYIGKYFSTEYIQKNILKQSEEEIKKIEIENNQETTKMEMEQMKQMLQQQELGIQPQEDPNSQDQPKQ
jgi:hypothetical protein